tara:strand:- start:65 stop:280 length:216 start_codon:yes stop_codon:yes gene_type:complete
MKIEEPEAEDLLENAAAREITQEIMRFGVSQPQILQIINLLALELEDNKLMKDIRNLIENHKNKSEEAIHV